MVNVTKTFPGVTALSHVDFRLRAGEIHGLVGENGAGKSTLIKILSGTYLPDGGHILMEGKNLVLHCPADAMQRGICTIYQELNLVPEMTVAENLFLGKEPVKNRMGWLDKKRIMQEAKSVMAPFAEYVVDCARPVSDLTLAQRQLVEIAKKTSEHARVLVLDEPTAILTEVETEILFALMRKLKREGVSIIYISHRLEEVFEICDKATVLRDGEEIGTVDLAGGDVTKSDLIRMMVGREIGDLYHQRNASAEEEVVLSTSGLTRTGEYQDVNFDLKKGEILGFAGLIGAGRTEVMKSIFGVTRPDSGEITLRGERFQPRNPSQAVAQGIGFAPEDRKKEGLILLLCVKENIGITHLEELSSCGFLKKKKFEDLVEFYIRELSIRTPFKEQVMSNLSGGNQQKTVLAKWLATNPQILILDEPTCGIDVGAKQEIYRLINTLADSGISIIVVSSEMPEVIGLCDRIIVMHEGRITGEFSRSEVSQERIMHAASGDIVHAE